MEIIQSSSVGLTPENQQLVNVWNNSRADAEVDVIICMESVEPRRDEMTDRRYGAFMHSIYTYVSESIKTTEINTDINGFACSQICSHNILTVQEIYMLNWIVFLPEKGERGSWRGERTNWTATVFLIPELALELDDDNFISTYIRNGTGPTYGPAEMFEIFIYVMAGQISRFRCYVGGDGVCVYTSKSEECKVILTPPDWPTDESFDLLLYHRFSSHRFSPFENFRDPPPNNPNSSRYGSKKKKKKKKNKNKNKKQIPETEEQITECNCCLEEDEEIAWKCKTCKRGIICVKCVKQWVRKNPDRKCPCCRT